MASGCDKCTWAVGVVAWHGHWVYRVLNDVISGQCVFKAQ